MKTLVWCAVFLHLLISPVWAAQSQDTYVPIDNFLNAVVTEYKPLSAQESAVQQAVHRAGAQISQQRPQLSLQGDFERYVNALINTDWVNTVSVVLSQRLDISGYFGAQERYYTAQVGAACADYASSVNSTLSNGAKYYCQAVWALHAITLQKQILESRRQAFEITNAKFQKKVVGKFDVLREQAKITDVERQIMEYRYQFDYYSAAVYNLLNGREISFPADLAVVPVSMDTAPASYLHPDVVKQVYMDKQAGSGAKMAATQDSYMGLTAQYYGGASRNSGYNDNELYTQLYVSLPLYDGGKVRESVAEYREQQKQARTLKISKETELAMDKKSCYEQWLKKSEQKALLETQLEYNQESYEIAIELYNKGFISQTDMLDSMNDVQNTTINYLRAILDMYTAAIDYATANGTFVETYLLNNPAIKSKPTIENRLKEPNR